MSKFSSLIESLKHVKGFDREAFVRAHEQKEEITSIRLNPAKPSQPFPELLHYENKIPWSSHGYYLPRRPSFTFDPLFHAGCYYVQEASSMFLEQAIRQTLDLGESLKLLDLAAAPGGKSTHLLSMISSSSLLVSNEVIRSRANILHDNLVKWGYANVALTVNDPRDFGELKNYFDAIIIDAPCSGSGLIRKDPHALEEWSEGNVQLCSQRQQRIIADVMPALKENGTLIYSTCSYSEEENEFIVAWLLSELGRAIEIIPLRIDPAWNIVESGGGYRFLPYKLKGEGFFIACFRKKSTDAGPFKSGKNNPQFLSKKELESLPAWISKDGFAFVTHKGKIHAIPKPVEEFIKIVPGRMQVAGQGICIGEMIRDKFIPDHALALSTELLRDVHSIELEYEQCINYLKRKEIHVKTHEKGWFVVSYQGHRLGWINVLASRINNYYPKSLRILKD